MSEPYYPARMPMRIQARPGSAAEKRYFSQSALPHAWPMPKAIARGISPDPLEDLIFHGGKIVPRMEFQNVYLGGIASWKQSDVSSIDNAIHLAMCDRRLNNVMAQYFHGTALSCDMRVSFVLDDVRPRRLDEPGIQAIVASLYDGKLIKRTDLDTAIFNLILPSGSVLKLGGSSSTDGLGGFHGSLHIRRGGKKITLYYSASVYSEIQASGRENGIAVFNKPWKNVVGTLYHEINEFRTDADVNDAIEKDNNDFLGWSSRAGHEVGDQPIFAAADLKQVFKEVKAAVARKRIPVQFMDCNSVHGAEVLIARPHA